MRIAVRRQTGERRRERPERTGAGARIAGLSKLQSASAQPWMLSLAYIRGNVS
ncbi:hypothetical protein GCM10027018_27870 [Paenibacillus thermoaerophilus]